MSVFTKTVRKISITKIVQWLVSVFCYCNKTPKLNNWKWRRFYLAAFGMFLATAGWSGCLWPVLSRGLRQRHGLRQQYEAHCTIPGCERQEKRSTSLKEISVPRCCLKTHWWRPQKFYRVLPLQLCHLHVPLRCPFRDSSLLRGDFTF